MLPIGISYIKEIFIMNDRELLYIKTITETKSISKAAKKLFIAQPSLSQALQKIEDNIGTKLFIRNRDGMKLTLAGEKYYLTAIKILNIYNDFKSEVSYINDLKSGRITIGITSFLGTYLLPKLLPQYIERYPNIEIYIKEESSTALEKALADATVDFAIMHYHPFNAKNFIDYDLLYRDPFLLVTQGNHPLTKDARKDKNYPYPLIDIRLFENENFILMDRGKRIRQVSDNIFYEIEIHPNSCLTLKNFETARRLASMGYGVTFVPMEYTKVFTGQYPSDYYFIDGVESAYWDTCIATRKNMYLSKAAKVFIELVHEFNKKEHG